MDDLNEHCINIDSQYRDKQIYEKTNKFTVKLENIIKNVKSIRLTSIEIPKILHTISCHEKNTTFFVNDTCLHLYEGYYSPEELIEHINCELENAHLNLKVYLNANTHCVMFISNEVFTLSFENTELGSVLGFHKMIYSNKHKYISESVMNTFLHKYVFLNVNDYGTMWNNGTKYRYLAKVLLDAKHQSVVFDSNNNMGRTHVFQHPTSITHFDIELRDKYNNLVNIKGDFSFTLAYKVSANTAQQHQQQPMKIHIEPPVQNVDISCPVNTPCSYKRYYFMLLVILCALSVYFFRKVT